MASSDPKRPRLTRRESQERTRRDLIAAAIDLFAANGVAGSPLNAVAEYAGFSRGAVHGNFADKDELASAVVASVAIDLGAQLAEVLSHPTSTRTRLADYITTSMDYFRTKPASAAAIVAAVGYLSRNGAESYDDRAKDSVGDLVALFEEGQRLGEMRSFDPLTMALALRSVLDTTAANLSGSRAPARTEAMTSEFVALFDHATRSTTITDPRGTHS
ncbi:MAG: TetR family transcriptional regulator [Brevibacterium sp.]|uniref:TetR/AcrR family transcriptional regulator n=1 Tax=Brevibacterium sandarakinum TaxID=629680 RepID=UPI002655B86D|nr:TetR/AcrR family transcriptional regulator [Brevibacterium sandarakinum]MDN5585079.1 TetR family transcriptional regulator [Brevibacterium sp.]MDN5634034.1 TetR family transcriptional regulator [Brevibacterium sp.]MDN5656917.1 TetR family transcriptional regulator [Brevibacterium sandarakinum]